MRHPTVARVQRRIGLITARHQPKGTTMNLLEIRTWGDVRAFLHVALPAIAGILAVAGYVTADTANLWIALVFVVVDAGLSTLNTADDFRKFLYPALAAAGALLIRYGYTTDEVWALWTGLVPVLVGGGVAAANTPTSSGRHARVDGR
jgi:hypothetical protein